MNYESTVVSESAAPLGADLDDADIIAARKRRRNILIGLAILVAGLVAFFAWRAMSQTAAPVGDDDSQAPVVSVIAPGRTTIEGEITATGSLAARRAMPVGVVGEGGRVVSVPVDAGDWVRQGQVLVVIDRSVQTQQAQSARSQIEVARADASLAQSNLDRALQLVERGFVSKADVDRLTSQRDAAAARVRVAQAQLNELLARNARLNIVAPASGLVLARNVEPGQTVSGGSSALFTIARGGEMELLAQVSEAQLASISAGTRASVVPVGSEKTFTGQVWQVSPTIDPQTRQGTARVSLAYAPELRPGGFATATISSGTLVAPMLPESAVLADDEGAYVYVIDNENKARRRSVETGMVTDEGIAIASGLNGREKVVLRAGGFLTEGETVSPKLQGK